MMVGGAGAGGVLVAVKGTTVESVDGASGVLVAVKGATIEGVDGRAET